MKQKDYKVSVAISALNEEKTIGAVVADLLAQKRDGWSLQEVIVYCDGCVDSTYEKVSAIKNKKLRCVNGKKRIGKVGRVNQALSEFKGEILLVVDADVRLANKNAISAIVSEFNKDKDVMVVSGNLRVNPPKSFFERAIYTSYQVYYESRESLNNGHNVYACDGGFFALRRKFAKKVAIPEVINEDTFLYFSCLSKGYKFRHASSALGYYQLAGNLKDFVKQIFRTHPEAIQSAYRKYFGDLITEEYRRPLGFYIRSILKVFLKNPLGTILMVSIKAACIPFFPFVSKKYRLDWYTAKSTKEGNFGTRKPRIIFSNYDDLDNPYYGGGGSVAVHEVAKRFAKKDEVTVYTGAYPGSRDKKVEGVNYKRIGVAFGGPRFGQLVYHFILPFYVMREEYNLWIESFTPPFSTSFLQAFTKKPVIGLVHMLSASDMQRKYKLPFSFIEKVGLKTYRRFIVVTAKAKDKITRINKRANIKVIPNGVNLPLRKGKRDGNTILYIGRIEIDQKGLDLLLKSFKRVRNNLRMELQIAGSGRKKEVQRLKDYIRELDLQDSVIYLGRVSGQEKERAISRAKILIIPSRYETFSLVALEALSHGIPIVAFDIEGLSWLSKKHALKVKAFDYEQMADAIVRLVKNQNLLEKMSKDGRKQASSYSWDKVFEKYYKFVNQTLMLGTK